MLRILLLLVPLLAFAAPAARAAFVPPPDSTLWQVQASLVEELALKADFPAAIRLGTRLARQTDDPQMIAWLAAAHLYAGNAAAAHRLYANHLATAEYASDNRHFIHALNQLALRKIAAAVPSEVEYARIWLTAALQGATEAQWAEKLTKIRAAVFGRDFEKAIHLGEKYMRQQPVLTLISWQAAALLYSHHCDAALELYKTYLWQTNAAGTSGYVIFLRDLNSLAALRVPGPSPAEVARIQSLFSTIAP